MRSTRALLVAAAVTALVPVSCAGPEDRPSLCPVFEDFIDERDRIGAMDPAEVTAAEGIDVAESYLAAVDHLRERADGRYVREIDAARTSVAEIVVTLQAIPADADRETWWPLVAEDLATAADASLTVEDVIAPSCRPEVDGTTIPPTTTEP